MTSTPYIPSASSSAIASSYPAWPPPSPPVRPTSRTAPPLPVPLSKAPTAIPGEPPSASKFWTGPLGRPTKCAAPAPIKSSIPPTIWYVTSKSAAVYPSGAIPPAQPASRSMSSTTAAPSTASRRYPVPFSINRAPRSRAPPSPRNRSPARPPHAVANAAGQFTLSALPPGTYEVEFFDGFNSVSRDFALQRPRPRRVSRLASLRPYGRRRRRRPPSRPAGHTKSPVRNGMAASPARSEA